MGQNAPFIIVNLGCGFKHLIGAVNVDLFPECNPDKIVDLNNPPYPFESESVDRIEAHHVFEHLDDWWKAFKECSRILRVGGVLNMSVPDDSSSGALGFRDHKAVITYSSFHGIRGAKSGTSGWAIHNQDSIPMEMESYQRVPFKKYNWLVRFPRILQFCADHMRNFIHEQRFTFRRVE